LLQSTSRQGTLNCKYNSSLEFGFITASSHMPTISTQLDFKAKNHLNKLSSVSKQDEVKLPVLRLSTNCLIWIGSHCGQSRESINSYIRKSSVKGLTH
jgi:hypothetical protein